LTHANCAHKVKTYFALPHIFSAASFARILLNSTESAGDCCLFNGCSLGHGVASSTDLNSGGSMTFDGAPLKNGAICSGL
ncbi:hypothetical protein, partial [Streptococcus pseudopneumoniae]|uniref:hypothetical protein n=1 Tax=Streptococcus pseudopneumoniae TaxID=257758 RepID=UPI0019D5B086